MSRALLAGLAACLLAGPALAAGDCPALPRREPMPVEAIPAPHPWTGWVDQVNALQARLPSLQLGTRRLVFLGDSITAGWDPGLFSQFYGARAPLLMGISGDVTQGMLDRMPAEWGPLRPRLAVLLIGTNNIAAGSRAEDIALGTAEVVRAIHARSSGTRVLIVGILPRGADASDPARAVAAQVNALTARCADGETVFFTDIGHALTNQAGQLSREVSFDLLHLTPVGYALMAMALEPEIRRIMNE